MSASLMLTRQSRDLHQCMFVAKLDNARTLSSILKAIHFKETATCFLSSNGLKITVENAKCVQGNAFVQSDIFQEFSFNEESATFKINMNVLLECLNIFGSKDLTQHTALKICYDGYGSPLVLLLEENGVLTDCSIRTQEPEETLDFDFCSANVVNKAILKAEGMREVFAELDMTSDVLQLLMSPDAPYFRLSTFGNAGSMHFEIPSDSEMMETFDCQQTQTNRFNITMLKPSLKALTLATKVSVRVDTRGFLSMQYMIYNYDGSVSFVEYLCAPDEDVEGENDIEE
ncbi:cell cycle checkpoint protein RAD1-like [Corticium candelabrum]|uniref:cell cycle checkpoint protein RAD1-like n=1 Tax=Corticium candelabrum TaxID=121492 RepID=UPI002E271F7B|nr:cell cycle checkpoint protein RAD1-like [Corticium candelabrum]